MTEESTPHRSRTAEAREAEDEEGWLGVDEAEKTLELGTVRWNQSLSGPALSG